MLLNVIISIVVVGVILWMVETYVPMSPPIKSILRVVIVLALILWLVRVFGLLGGGPVVLR